MKTRTFYDILKPEQWIEIPGISAFKLCWDGMPVTTGHMLIISRDPNVKTYFDLDASPGHDDIRQLDSCIKTAKQMIIDKFGEPDGWNIGMYCGEASGQTVMHFHCHLIPRWTGDTKDPRGGVRNVIPDKGNYATDQQRQSIACLKI